MRSICRKLRERLATDGPPALKHDESARRHVAECDDCYAFLEALSEIETGLRNLPPQDAPDSVVDSLLARPEIARPAAVVGRPRRGGLRAFVEGLLRPRPLVWGSVAAVFLIVAVVVGLRDELPLAPTESLVVTENRPAFGEESGGSRANEGPEAEREIDSNEVEQRRRSELATTGELSKVGGDAELRLKDALDENRRVGDKLLAEEPSREFYRQDLPVDPDDDGRSAPRDEASRDFRTEVGGVRGSAGKDDLDFVDDFRVVVEAPGVELERTDTKARGDGSVTAQRAAPPPPPPPPARKAMPRKKPATDPTPVAPPPSGPLLAGVAGVSRPVAIEESRVEPDYPELARVARLAARVVLQVVVRADGTVSDVEVLDCSRAGLGFEQAAVEAVEQWRYEPARSDGKPVDAFLTVVVEFDLDPAPADNSLAPPPVDDGVRAARAFLDERGRADGHAFRPARGYWSNSYVPGDPLTRLLRSRLAGWDRSALAAYVPTAPRLHDGVRRIGQPFDAPDAAALAVYLHADRRGATERSRMLVQVGIEGTPRRGGRRPAMNLAVVLDLRDEISTEESLGVRALLDAFNRAQEPGDRFRLLVAGKPGGLVVRPDEFRHGFLRVTLDRLITGAADADARQTLDLVDALTQAISGVAANDDPSTSLGSSAVILVTARPLGTSLRAVADLAHQGAVAGIPVSVVGIGSAVDPSEIDRVALAGQGRRRLLDEPSAAAALVDRELAAASRAVARAVRLRIRLAPGVELIDVLGSERLDATRTRRVREAERSIDLRLARNLGIQADRGEDEDGIQIVIPAFHAGDSHVILLDVVAPGPGPVADVTVRFKDLVHLRNGVARASLELERSPRPAGPLERNVLKNLLSFRLSRTLDAAGRAVRRDDAARAATLLEELAGLLEGLRRELPGLDSDPEIARDLTLLDEYHALLAGGLAGDPDQRGHLADSLRYAARLKRMPHHPETRS